jgi:hypothetical protein
MIVHMGRTQTVPFVIINAELRQFRRAGAPLHSVPTDWTAPLDRRDLRGAPHVPSRAATSIAGDGLQLLTRFG